MTSPTTCMACRAWTTAARRRQINRTPDVCNSSVNVRALELSPVKEVVKELCSKMSSSPQVVSMLAPMQPRNYVIMEASQMLSLHPALRVVG